MATIKIRKAGNLASSTYQWTTNEKNWYWVSDRNIITKGPGELVRNLFNACLLGLTARAQGNYNRKTKTLNLVL